MVAVIVNLTQGVNTDTTNGVLSTSTGVVVNTEFTPSIDQSNVIVYVPKVCFFVIVI